MAGATVFSCTAARASVNAQDASGAWRHLGVTGADPVTVPGDVRTWVVTAHDPDDDGLAALVAAVNAAGAPGLVVGCGRLSRDGLRAVRELRPLHRFGLRAVASFAADGVRDPYLTSRELGYLYGLTGVEHLSFEGGRLRLGPVLKLARRLPALAHLTLSGCLRDDAGLERLGELAALRALTVHGPSEYGEHPDWLEDAGLARLARLPRLEALDLWRCKRITDAGVAALAGHPALRDLTLGDPDHSYLPGDLALEAAARLPALRRLTLHGCGRVFTLEGLRHLARAPLTELRLVACHLTPDALGALQARFPGARAEVRAITTHLTWPGPPR